MTWYQAEQAGIPLRWDPGRKMAYWQHPSGQWVPCRKVNDAL